MRRRQGWKLEWRDSNRRPDGNLSGLDGAESAKNARSAKKDEKGEAIVSSKAQTQMDKTALDLTWYKGAGFTKFFWRKGMTYVGLAGRFQGPIPTDGLQIRPGGCEPCFGPGLERAQGFLTLDLLLGLSSSPPSCS